MSDHNDLALEDLTDDNIPPEAVICSRCGGYGLIVAWAWGDGNIMQTSDDCNRCEGKGWMLPIDTQDE